MYKDNDAESDFFQLYVKRTKKLAILRQRALQILQEHRNMNHSDEESEEVKNLELECSKCSKGKVNNNRENKTRTYPHIQDLCPADKKRIAQLVKHLAKCTREVREAKSELAVNEAEKEALNEQFRSSIARQESEKKRLESQLRQSEAEKIRLKTDISRALDMLTKQITGQHEQFVGLADSVNELLLERVRLRNDIVRKNMRLNELASGIRRMEETRAMEKLMRTQERAKSPVQRETVHRSCQTDSPDQELTFKDIVEHGNRFGSISHRAKRTKSKDDLEEPTPEVTLMRDLFFRNPSIEDIIGTQVIPKLSNCRIQSDHPGYAPFT